MSYFPTEYESILRRIKSFDPSNYSKTRNFENGKVSYLSPYISRGVISTSQIYRFLKHSDYSWNQCRKFIQELAWREHWQLLWRDYKTRIDSNFKHKQSGVLNRGIPKSIVKAQTGIQSIDDSINHLYKTGYMHNHLRMYVASICCNVARSHWKSPSQWMYYHLLDGDVASNYLSWQWVAGTYSNKTYYANQENINKFTHKQQFGTFLDTDYTDLQNRPPPKELLEIHHCKLETLFPQCTKADFDFDSQTLIYNYYNLDPLWKKDLNFQKILLIEPSLFARYPVSPKCIQFILDLTQNISGIKIFVGEFNELSTLINPSKITYKEHPLNLHYSGNEEPRDWLTDSESSFASFFKFWNYYESSLKF